MGADLTQLDVCECGDYRRDHRDGVGPCRFNGQYEYDCHAGKKCLRFRLLHTADPKDANVKLMLAEGKDDA